MVRLSERHPLSVSGEVLVEVFEAGELVRAERHANRITSVGLNLVRDYVLGTISVPARFAIGTGESATTSGMTALEAEVFRDQFTRKVPSQARATFQYQLAGADPPTQPVTIQEAALFTLSGVMFSRVKLSPINKNNTVEVTFTWDVSFAVGVQG
jgi:hypothetical protein